jgi:hypothetical protein
MRSMQKKINLNLKKKVLTLEAPHGTLAPLFFPKHSTGKSYFSSDLLIWDHTNSILTLKNHISFRCDDLGTLQSNGELVIQTREGHADVQTIEATGKTRLELVSPETEEKQTLTSYGTITINRENDTILGKSPSIEDQQLSYEKGHFILYADEGEVKQSVSVDLRGHVRVLSKDPHKSSRCAVADRLYYDFLFSTIHLLADTGKKVLFWDEGKNITMSAQEIRIYLDGKEERVKGIGPVRFSFNEEEQNMMQKFFYGSKG